LPTVVPDRPQRSPIATRTRVRIAVLLGLLALAAMLPLPDISAHSLLSGFSFSGLTALGLAGACFVYLGLLGLRLIGEVEAARGAVLAAAPDGALPPLRSDGPPLREVAELREAISRRLAEAGAAGVDDRRLALVVAALPDGVIVATPEGLISVVNQAGRRALGATAGLIGTSLFGRLSRATIGEAVDRARQTGLPGSVLLARVGGGTLPAQIAVLAGDDGFLILLREVEPCAEGAEPAVEIDLTLHDRPPEAPAPTELTPLVDLPLLSLDCETTGMDPAADRIVSLGAVRLHGRRLLRAHTLDILVRPGRRIPAKSSAIHRITDAMVADAPEIQDHWPGLLAALSGVAVVGHHIDFDLAMLRSAAQRHGLPWTEPLALDTARLAAALDPAEADLDLAEVARRHGVIPTGRHTALGDSLATAELYLRLLPRLTDLGVATLGDAMRFGLRAKSLVAAQAATSWGKR
jgi:DNA polymerase-3 subunit epsilon